MIFRTEDRYPITYWLWVKRLILISAQFP